MTTLLTITHDPEGKQTSHFSDELFSIFDNSFVIATQDTSPDLLDLINSRCTLQLKPKNGMCQARRDVVELAWEQSPAADSFFYCDFDRLLFWWKMYPDELKHIISYSTQFTVLGRTQEALKTYPALQYETERAMNQLVGGRLFDLDLFAGARLFSPVLSKMLIQCQGEDAVLDVHWPLVVQKSGCKIDYIATNGLAYEANLLGLTRTNEEETELRTRNLKSILDYVRK